jgi:DNA polymerase-3 subunit alpha
MAKKTTTDFYTFDCGCKFKILGEPKNGADIPLLELTPEFFYRHIPLNCPATWALLGSGRCRGVFQLETPLGRHWAKEIKPVCIEDLSAIGALLRPGCLKAISEGKSMTLHYADRKNGKEPVTYPHSCLESVLQKTYGILTYQEQALAIARVVANFSLADADLLRIAIGKKLPEEMAKMKIKFMEGAKAHGLVTEKLAEEIFGWIEKGQRYSFNKSHSVSYGINGYWTAYLKAHFPVQFFTSYLRYALDKADSFDEIKELVEDTKLFDLNVLPPDLRNREHHFHFRHRNIYFGLLDIKGVGEKRLALELEKLTKSEELLDKPLGDWTWLEVLLYFLSYASKSFVQPLIHAGALDWTGVGRKAMLFDYSVMQDMTDKELEWARTAYDPAIESLKALIALGAKPKKEGGAAANKTRVQRLLDAVKLLENPPHALQDDNVWVSWMEAQTLGIPVTASVVGHDTGTTVMDLIKGECRTFCQIAAEITRVKVINTRKGDKMAFLTISDHSGTTENIACFPQQFSEFSSLLSEKNVLIFDGKYEREKNSFIIQRVKQI